MEQVVDNKIFENRIEAGRLLAEKLINYKNANNLLILALPRGGVPVAFEIAKSLAAPLDVFIVRKLGVPWQPELAMGAIALGDVIVFNDDVLEGYQLSLAQKEAVIAKEKEELKRRNEIYRHSTELPEIKDKTIILVDDGVATGATMKAAIKAIKQLACGKLIVACPVAPPHTVLELAAEVDEVVCLETPEYFLAIGQFYSDFTQTSDEEVQLILKQAKK